MNLVMISKVVFGFHGSMHGFVFALASFPSLSACHIDC